MVSAAEVQNHDIMISDDALTAGVVRTGAIGTRCDDRLESQFCCTFGSKELADLLLDVPFDGAGMDIWQNLHRYLIRKPRSRAQECLLVRPLADPYLFQDTAADHERCGSGFAQIQQIHGSDGIIDADSHAVQVIGLAGSLDCTRESVGVAPDEDVRLNAQCFVRFLLV